MNRPTPDDLPQTLPLRCAEAAAPPSKATQAVPRPIDAEGTVDGSTTPTPVARPEELEAARERPSSALRAVVHVPGYEVLGELGRGGMGIVYKATHLALKRTVALKMIRDGSYADEAELARFRTEAEAVGRLAHQNIVQIYEVGEREKRGRRTFSHAVVELFTLSHFLPLFPPPFLPSPSAPTSSR
ncbi:MAG TPA: protein kinase [Gemmataceae bacterium]|nr:protein kinase [Gemmataceae bacterium]